MAAVFSSAQTLRGAFRADKMKVQFGPVQAGMLAQQINFSYTQQVSLFYEVGSADVYMLGGRASGTAALSRIVGPSNLAAGFLTQFGDVCRAPDNNISFRAAGGCTANNTNGINYRLEGCVIVTIGAAVSSNDIVVSEQVSMMFVNLDRQ